MKKIVYNLAWQVRELEILREDGRKPSVDISVLLDALSSPDTDYVGRNVALLISNLKKKLTSFVEGLSKHERTAAIASSPGPIPSFINVARCKAGGPGTLNHMRDISHRENFIARGRHV